MELLKNRENRIKILIILIFILGFSVRLIGIADFPNALNRDEASSGYEAYSILNYGIDRNGNKLPIFLVSWGSGQNALLSYLIIPFIKIFGLNVLAVRLPMAIIGCISLIIFYFLLKKISNRRLAIIGLTFLAICPWHIMKSRWGLESNLFPDIILMAVYFLIKGIEDKNIVIYYLSFVIFGISAYTYGTSYFFLPLFLIPLLIVLVKNQKVSFIQAIISIVIVAIVSLPIILYVLINTFNLEQINLPFMTIPKLQVNRYEVITEFSITNFIEAFKILLFQYDGNNSNSLQSIGTIYLFSVFFTIVGLIESFRKNKKEDIKYDYVFKIWFLISLFLTIICVPNINRLNIIMFPIIYYTLLGIHIIVKERTRFAIFVLLAYITYFSFFTYKYFEQDWNEYYNFSSGLEDVIDYAKDQDENINFPAKINYIYVLYYTKYSPIDFCKNVKYINKNEGFWDVKNFDKYYFENVDELKPGYRYITKKKGKDKLDFKKFEVKEFDKYLVLKMK